MYRLYVAATRDLKLQSSDGIKMMLVTEESWIIYMKIISLFYVDLKQF